MSNFERCFISDFFLRKTIFFDILVRIKLKLREKEGY